MNQKLSSQDSSGTSVSSVVSAFDVRSIAREFKMDGAHQVNQQLSSQSSSVTSVSSVVGAFDLRPIARELKIDGAHR
jgi:hypothetical protein